MQKRTRDVFGISNKILEDSYIDRGHLDSTLQKYLVRDTHVAIRGESKCGKSWLRQKNLVNPIVVQCRLSMTISDIFAQALSQLNIRFETEEKSGEKISGKLSAEGEVGIKLLAKVKGTGSIESTEESSKTLIPAGKNVHDLKFIVEIIRESGRRLVIEDFHYLSLEERKHLAFDLKAMWDLGYSS